MSTDIAIHRVTKPDAATMDAFLAVMRSTARDFVPPLDQRVDLHDYAQKLATNACFSVATADTRVIGFFAFYANDQQTRLAYGTLLVVDPAWRRAHIGTQLLGDALGWAADLGMDEMRLETWATNPARSLYERFGFRPVGHKSRDGFSTIGSIIFTKPLRGESPQPSPATAPTA